MNTGIRREAIALAKERWAAIHSFDLDDATWNDLVRTYRYGVILQAIKLTQDTCDPRPEKRYARFERMLNQLSAWQSDTQIQ